MSLEIEGFEFERFFLDSKEKILLRDSKPFPITPKTFQLLHLLVENHGHIVEKEEIMQKVWSDSFVEDSNLTFSISQLRKILEDDAQNPHFIETIPRRGYRFIAETLEKTSDSTAVFNNGLPENEPLAAMLEKKETFKKAKNGSILSSLVKCGGSFAFGICGVLLVVW